MKKQELARAHKKNEYREELESLMDEKDKIVELLLTKLKLRDILNHVTIVHNADQTSADFNKVKDLIANNSALLETTENHSSFFILYWNILTRSLVYSINGEPEKLFESRSKGNSLWNQHPDIKNEYYYLYLFDLNNFMSEYRKRHQQDKVFEILIELEKETPRNYFDKVWIFKRVAIEKLIHFMTKGGFNEALQLIPGIEQGLEKYNINISSKITLILNVATLYYCLEDFQTCYEWSNKVIQSSKSKLRLDVQRFARLYSIISLIEMDTNYETVDNFFRSSLRFLKKTGIKDKTHPEYILLDSLWKYHDATTSERKKVLTNFKEEIIKMKSDKKMRSTLGLDELFFWIRSKLEKRPMAQLIKESQGKTI